MKKNQLGMLGMKKYYYWNKNLAEKMKVYNDLSWQVNKCVGTQAISRGNSTGIHDR